MHSISPNSLLPTILNTLDPAGLIGIRKTVNPKAATGATTTTTSSSSTGGDLGTTFLNLLSTELQNQDPTAPVDSTAMVGQMISLNQLDQLISINQALNPTTTATTTAGVQPAAAALHAADASAIAPSTANGASNQLPFNPDTMMPVSTFPGPASISSSRTSNSTTGGK